MKRSSELRRTPLTAKSTLRRRAGLARSTLHAGSTSARTAPRRRTADPVPSKVRVALSVRSEGKCEIQAPGCYGTASDLAHRKKVGAGGRKGAAARAHHVLSNILAACRGCHSGCHAAPAAAYWVGWMLREGEDPRTVPCLYRGVWSLLDDDGSISTTTSTPEETNR